MIKLSLVKYVGSLAKGLKLSPHQSKKLNLKQVFYSTCNVTTFNKLNRNSKVYQNSCKFYSTDESHILNLKPEEFQNFMKDNDISRCYAVWDSNANKAVVSHSILEPLAEWLNEKQNPYFDQHEAIFLQLGVRTGHLLGAFIWNTQRGEACGGIRMMEYPNMEGFFGDGLRLSVRLGRKSALAGLWMGGGKGLIPEYDDRQHVNPIYRQKLFWDYGDFVSSLNGCYVAGTDVGVNIQDLYNVHSRTRWAVCGPEDIGGCGNPFELLVKGVMCAMEAGLDHLGMGGFEGKRVVVEGAGGIGTILTSSLLDANVNCVYVTETNKKRVDDIIDMLGEKSRGKLVVEKVPIGDHSALKRSCDILAPCAVGHVFSAECIPYLNTKIICGTANAQLENPDDCKLFKQKRISYIVESLVNRMALVSSSYESLGRMPVDPAMEKHFDKEWDHSIYVLTQRILRDAAEKNISTIEAANNLAKAFVAVQHPLWPNRGQLIIEALVNSNWHEGNDFWRRRSNFAPALGCA